MAKVCLVSFRTNRYSVPFRFAGQPVEVQGEADRVLIYHNGKLVMTHPRCEGRHRCISDQTHYAGIYHRPALDVTTLRYPSLPDDLDVQVRDLGVYERLVEGGAR